MPLKTIWLFYKKKKGGLGVLFLTDSVQKTTKSDQFHKTLNFDLEMLQKHLGYEKAFNFHELFHEKQLSKLLKFLSNF